jgi:hypothetical protein
MCLIHKSQQNYFSPDNSNVIMFHVAGSLLLGFIGPFLRPPSWVTCCVLTITTWPPQNRRYRHGSRTFDGVQKIFSYELTTPHNWFFCSEWNNWLPTCTSWCMAKTYMVIRVMSPLLLGKCPFLAAGCFQKDQFSVRSTQLILIHTFVAVVLQHLMVGTLSAIMNLKPLNPSCPYQMAGILCIR